MLYLPELTSLSALPTFNAGWDSLVGIATRYRLDGPGIKFQWGRDFLHPSPPDLGPTSLLYNGYRLSFLGRKAAGAWR
jgi:hypothetical protein